MEVEQALRERIIAILGEEIGERVFPDMAPIGTATPYVVFSQVGGTPLNFLDPTIPSKKNSRQRIYVWDELRDTASRVARAIEDGLVGAPLHATVMTALAGANDEGSGLRGTQQDFSIWYPSDP